MSKPLKAATIALWLLAVMGMISVVALRIWENHPQGGQADAAILASDGSLPVIPIIAPSFDFTDQLGRSVTTASLQGHPWIADFIFTQCASTCPLMSAHFSKLQSQIPPSVKFISFSVDPDHDTPPVLLTYAAQYNADNDRWRFLTGKRDDVFAAIDAMKVTVIPADANNPIRHDVHFILFDDQGRVRGLYDSRIPDNVDQLVKDATTLAHQESNP
jgi:cytochrome oxidase Cu insertion factor (SCO1/SenC/PrrC family)